MNANKSAKNAINADVFGSRLAADFTLKTQFSPNFNRTAKEKMAQPPLPTIQATFSSGSLRLLLILDDLLQDTGGSQQGKSYDLRRVHGNHLLSGQLTVVAAGQ